MSAGRFILGPLEVDFEKSILKSRLSGAEIALGPRVADAVVEEQNGEYVARDRKGRIIGKGSDPGKVVQVAVDSVPDGGLVVVTVPKIVTSKSIRVTGAAKKLILNELEYTGSEDAIVLDGHSHVLIAYMIWSNKTGRYGVRIIDHRNVVLVQHIGGFIGAAVYIDSVTRRSGFNLVVVSSMTCGEYGGSTYGDGIVVEGASGQEAEGNTIHVIGAILYARRGIILNEYSHWNRVFADIDAGGVTGTEYLAEIDGMNNLVFLYGWTTPASGKTILFGPSAERNRVIAIGGLHVNTIDGPIEKNQIITQYHMNIADPLGDLMLWFDVYFIRLMSTRTGWFPFIGFYNTLDITQPPRFKIEYNRDGDVFYVADATRTLTVWGQGNKVKDGLPLLTDCADLPSSGEYVGQVYVCYDSNAGKWVLKVWDGSAWQTIG